MRGLSWVLVQGDSILRILGVYGVELLFKGLGYLLNESSGFRASGVGV